MYCWEKERGSPRGITIDEAHETQKYYIVLCPLSTSVKPLLTAPNPQQPENNPYNEHDNHRRVLDEAIADGDQDTDYQEEPDDDLEHAPLKKPVHFAASAPILEGPWR